MALKEEPWGSFKGHIGDLEGLLHGLLTGLLLRNLNWVTILGEPYYLLYLPIVVT